MKTKKTKSIFFILLLVWSLLAISLYLLNDRSISKETYRNIKLQAQSYYYEILLLNQWNIKEKTSANNYISNQLAHLSYSKNGLVFKIIERDSPVFNDKWELKVLDILKSENDDTLQAFYNSKNEIEYYKYIAPFNFENNKIVSVISITINAKSILKGISNFKTQLFYIYLFVYLIGMFTIVFLGYFIVKYQTKMIRERKELLKNKNHLSDLNENIEKSIFSLEKTNSKLNKEIKFRKRIEMELIDNEKNFKMIFEKANDAILIISNTEIIDCNSKALDLFECNKKELIGANPLSFSPKFQNDGSLSENNIIKYLKQTTKGENVSIEWLHKKLHGSEFDTKVSLSFLSNYFGKEVILAIIRDVSEEKKHKRNLEDLNVQLEERQEELSQQNEEIKTQNDEIKKQKQIAEFEAEKALEASKYKSVFLASMSHEIRTPLNGIISMVDILKQTKISKEQSDYLKIVDISGSNLLSIINDILDYSKIEANQLDLENIVVNLFDEISNVVKMLSFKTQKKELKLTASISPDVEKYILGDPVRISQVLINYCNNAIKFTEKGQINISVTKLNEDSKYTEIKFSVQDTGIGISKINIRKLFQEFQQANSDTARKYGGTGLGLAISKKIARLFNGKVGVESVEGKGSTFWFTGRFEKTDLIINNEKKKYNITSVAKLNILLVEDNLINQKVAQININKIGHKLTIANNGKEAFEIYKDNIFDVILMDIQMPILDGYGATKQIRQYEKEESIKPIIIIALTANALKGEKEKCIKMGMNNYLAKPFKYNELIEVLDSELNANNI